MDFDELKEELRQAYRDGDLTVQEYLAELKALREEWNGATKGKFWNFPRALSERTWEIPEFPLEI